MDPQKRDQLGESALYGSWRAAGVFRKSQLVELTHLRI
ncbi:hypothetical protein PSYRMG_23485 [Pseudomonas syringae UMAF0158]|jgi:hypothetical protein|nr:hypothetical protein PSYRMG_23485 [Pseudomonas syringae UMAF0158]